MDFGGGVRSKKGKIKCSFVFWLGDFKPRVVAEKKKNKRGREIKTSHAAKERGGGKTFIHL